VKGKREDQPPDFLSQKWERNGSKSRGRAAPHTAQVVFARGEMPMSDPEPVENGDKPLTIGLTLNVPFAALRSLIEELTALQDHTPPDSISRELIERIIERFQKSQAEIAPSIEAFRNQVRTAAQHAAFFAEKAAEAGRDTAPVVQNIARSIQELAEESDEELMRRSREVGSLMNRLNEFLED
jgi:hypothetical protein